MAKFLFIDYWTAGQHQFRPLFERLRLDGHDCVLFHLGSWRDPTVPREEIIDGLVARDISFYGTNDILTALRKESGDAAVLLNTTLLIDRIIIRSCRHLGIKTAYLMHGVKAFGDQVEPALRDVNRHWSWRRRVGKLRKYAGLAAQYLRTVARTGAADLLVPSTYMNFVELLFTPAKGLDMPRPHPDLHCDRALVYSDVYRELLVGAHGYPANRVIIVGNPSLDSAAGLLAEPSARVRAAREAVGLDRMDHYLLYLEDAFVEQGTGGWTEATRLECLRTVADCARSSGLKLVIKLHPAANPKPARTVFLNDAAVIVVERADLPALIAGADASVGHLSTTLQTVVFLSKPLLIVGWYPKLLGYDAYARYGAGVLCATPEDFRLALQDLDGVAARSRAGRDRYRERFLGPADGGTWRRVSDSVLSLARE